MGENLLHGRWILLGAAALLAALAVAGPITPTVAVLVFVVVAALVAFTPSNRGSAWTAPATPSADGADRDAVLSRLIEALPDPSLVLDQRGVVRLVNSRVTSDVPLRAGDSLPLRVRVPQLIAAFERVAHGGPPERIDFMERGAPERWYAAWFARLDLPSAALPAAMVLLILDDLTQRRRMEQVQGDFVANASHELRTPLASLTGFIETLQGSARNDPAARERFLSIMHDQATRMSRLIADLLSLSRVELKAHVRPTERVDLGATVNHVADALEPLGRELGVNIEVQSLGAAIEVVGDRDELIQVFENLIENACKYGQSGGRVLVTVAAPTDGSGPAVSVRDFGPGIAEEHVPRLTERFYRVDVDVSRRHRGTGLGLAIVKHILARHQARMTITSAAGQGATFTVTFPRP